ncbi:MAG: dihydrofolate reductase [Candidatus Azotimanducaceae bacterium]|jgi:dihydrofolate reductase
MWHLIEGNHPMANFVYIATSLDGRISSPDGTLDWLETVPNPTGDDLGFFQFIKRVDAIVMGRLTFETVVGFGLDWHYPLPGIVLSSTLDTVPDRFKEHVQLVNAPPEQVVALAQQRGFNNLYIDGGQTIQRFLQADLIDEMIITEIPLLLGGGDRLFGELQTPVKFELVSTDVLLDQLVKKHWRRSFG